MNYKNRIYDTVTTYMKKLSELDSFEKELAAQERAEIISRVHAAERREEWEQQRKDAYENTINEIEHIRRSHTEAVDKWNELSGDKLSADAELLKMDISMDQRQFQALCSKHKDNSLMLQLLLHRGDAPGIPAADDPPDLRGQLQAALFRPDPIADNVHGDARSQIPQHREVQVHVCVDFQDVLFAHFFALGVADDGHLAVQFIQFQCLVNLHAAPGGDVVQHNAVLHCVDVHASASFSSFKIRAIRMNLPFRTCLK